MDYPSVRDKIQESFVVFFNVTFDSFVFNVTWFYLFVPSEISSDDVRRLETLSLVLSQTRVETTMFPVLLKILDPNFPSVR